jgi:hypothetical protein
MVIESEPDALHMDTSIAVNPTPEIAVATPAPEGLEDRLDSAVIPEAESVLSGHEIKTEGGDADQDFSPSEVGESDRLTEIEPQIIPAIMEESPSQIEEHRPDLTVLQVRQLLSLSLPTDR